jgi:hypothetical protein
MASQAGSYLGQSKTGSGKAIPVFTQGPMAGQIDINALIASTLDRRKKYFHDMLKLAPGATVANTPYLMFQVPLGAQDPYNGNIAKTMLETNMRSGGMFNPPYDLIVNNLGFKFNEDVLLFDMEQLLKLCWFDFKILEKTMWDGGLWRHPPGAGVSGATSATSEAAWNNGIPEPGAIWWFGDYKKYIPPLVNFSLTLNFPESYNTFFNSNLPANVAAQGTAGTNLPTLASQAKGSNGVQLDCILNGLSDGPVQ